MPNAFSPPLTPPDVFNYFNHQDTKTPRDLERGRLARILASVSTCTIWFDFTLRLRAFAFDFLELTQRRKGALTLIPSQTK